MASADNPSQRKAAIPSPARELFEPKRHGLIAQLVCAAKLTKLDSITWACLWFADLSELESLVSFCGRNSPYGYMMHRDLSKSEDKSQVIDAWAVSRPKEELEKAYEDEESDTEGPPIKKRRLTLNTEESPSSAEEAATHLANRLCTERDNATCVVTGCRDPVEIAHILPNGLGRMETQTLQEFWFPLHRFWSKERVMAWMKQAAGQEATEACSNFLCMTDMAHKLWKKARFALKPLSLSEDRRSLQVQFYWLPVYNYRSRIPATEVPRRMSRKLSGTTVDGKETMLFNIATNKKLCSGDILTFKTNDPNSHPLPSMELLDMQWVLNRVLALSGATYATDEELYPDFSSNEGSFWDSEEGF
ncbi:HNH endonuclease signature motif containing protein [Aspergillus vadensis CBS 113365]|uniref:HNH nuclease domain-containing protein n=1 Tax=Aspergillus vadensis (strain CBS 113365 / IMI 142717 / IBT 24658) TaxID=1448311 RepID=A0A319B461_ASPVC|nr:hypothetical protein BO88DRAFT_343847 [Aspergillus vadensis CBS 113365]PYH67557.1 hypothetical protein BO88DRAFT_343847 [Aspergillus vadensis CBS 113365]